MDTESLEQQTLVVLMRSGQDSVARVTGLLRSRQVQLETISVSRTADDGKLQLTLMIRGDADDALRVTKQIARLISVQHVENIVPRPHVARALALIKVAGAGDNLPRINEVCREYRAHVIDDSLGALIIEMSGEADEIDSLTSKLEPLGILEMVRHGAIALGKGERTLQRAIQDKPI